MAEVKFSKLLEMIMQRADKLKMENSSGGVSREYIVAAALEIVESCKASDFAAEAQDEYRKLAELVKPEGLSSNAHDQLIDTWRGKPVPVMEPTILTLLKNRVIRMAIEEGRSEVPADSYIAAILRDKTGALKEVFGQGKKPEPERPWEAAAREEASRTESKSAPQPAMPAEKAQAKPEGSEVFSINALVERTKKLRTELAEEVLGQEHAVSVFASGYFHAELQARLEKDRRKPKATFLFAGPPGVGKTFLSERAAAKLGLAFKRFDMSEYANPNAVDELSGSDRNYKGSSEGQLTGFVAANPKCILLFDEIEKASLEVIHLFLQTLDAGRLRDNRTDQEVEFKDAIMIFTTNAGKKLYEESEGADLSNTSRKVILDALGRDINPRTNEPFFPAAICSRFASGNVVMFNHLEAHILHNIVERQLKHHLTGLEKELGVTSAMNEDLATTLLLAEGAKADARTVKSRADAFFGGELYELYRMATSARSDLKPDQIRNIRIEVELPEEDEEIRDLFRLREPLNVLVLSPRPVAAPVMPGLCEFNCVRTVREAEKALDESDVNLILCDPGMPEEDEFLNREDEETIGRDFIIDVLHNRTDLPMYLMERQEGDFTAEEKESYRQRGVRGFVKAGVNDLANSVREIVNIIHQQQSLRRLSSSNRLVTYETAQRLEDDDKTATILLFDLKLQVAVRSDDQQNVLSGLSRPKTRFKDVIGAKDAKDELEMFVDYLKNPRKYKGKKGLTPKGILLYGPPGTGKTMLAKALAGEADVTFIAAEGNQFFDKYVGVGKDRVHQLFATARRYAPSILFVDEIDTIAKKRTGGDNAGSQTQEQVLTAFLAEMDGFKVDPNKPVFVMGATNYGVDGGDMSLDPAILRRFDRQIFIDLPDREARKTYIRRETSDPDTFDVSDECVDSLAERSTGMSLALLENVIKRALREALRYGGEKITDARLDEAFELYNSGSAKKWDSETVLRTARHESGHAIISWLMGEKPSYVTIVSRASHGGYMQSGDQEDRMGYTRRELLGRIRTALAGRAAEIVYYGPEEGVGTGASSDLQTATNVARAMLCRYGMSDDFGLATVTGHSSAALEGEVRAQVNAILREEMDKTVAMVREHRAAIDAMVAMLMEKNHLNGADIDKVLSGVVK